MPDSTRLPRIEDLDVDDLAGLPPEYRYELHDGNLVISVPPTYWHKVMGSAASVRAVRGWA